jgi:hypothetical protein
MAAVFALDLAVLAELAAAIYFAHLGDPQEFTLTFLKVFFGLLIPTLVGGRYALRMVR